MWVAAGLLLAAPVFAERIQGTVADVTPIYDGEGSARILFRVGPAEAMEDVAVRRALLRWSVAAEPRRSA
jgi:hypothetical protein